VHGHKSQKIGLATGPGRATIDDTHDRLLAAGVRFVGSAGLSL
jgi:hypothetical protein